MKIKDCMKRNVYTVTPTTSIAEAAKIFSEKHVGSLPVVNSQGKLVGMVQLRNLLEFVLPDFLKLLDDFDFVPDFGAIEQRVPSAEVLSRPIESIMGSPVSVSAESGLLRAFSLLHQHQIHDLSVVDEQGVLIGIVSRVDIGAAFLSGWNVTQGG